MPFLVVYLNVIFYFTAIFAQTEKHGEKIITSDDDFPGFPSFIKGALTTWNLGLGSMNYEFSTPVGVSVYFASTLLSVIVMLNILISVVSEIYAQFLG